MDRSYSPAPSAHLAPETPARDAMRADADADADDAAHALVLAALARRCDAMRDKASRVRVRAWMDALSAPERVVELRRHCNRHARLLLAQILDTGLRRPFDGMPPCGRLPRFAWDDAVGYDLRGVLERDAATSAQDAATTRVRTARSVTESEASEDDAVVRVREIEVELVDEARARVNEVGVARETRAASRASGARVEELELEVKKLRAQTERQAVKIASLKEELAKERQARTTERLTSRARHERDMRDTIAAAGGRAHVHSVSRSSSIGKGVDAAKDERKFRSSGPSTSHSQVPSSADPTVGAEFDAFMLSFQLETERLRKLLQSGRNVNVDL